MTTHLDMLMVDRLRQWANNLNNYGADIGHWGSVPYVGATMCDIATGIEDAIKASQGWQPIATAPTTPNCHRVLTYDGERTTVGYQDAYYAEGGRGYTGQSGWVNDEGEQFNPTHWMPLPPPPETGATR